MIAIGEIREFLRVSKPVCLGYSEINFLNCESFENEQVGYSLDDSGSCLTSNKKGDWQMNWIVIGNDSIGDPIIIDVTSTALRVFSAMHGQGNWEPFIISDSLTSFEETIKLLYKLSNGRGNPADLDRNPITENERNQALYNIKKLNPNSEMEYWAAFLED